jgi:ATP-binding cassette subfamily B (MDR/TAP) protein 1
MSGGQKQRIAIARAIIKKPRILLLDEATSALDSQSEAVVQESLDKIMQGKTSIAIAHRISTIKDANEILLFDRGVVAERGTYEELVKAQGMFYKLEKGI